MQHWWVQEFWEVSPILLVSWVVWVIGSIVLHELAHGWAAIACGDRTPVETGHMTLNPVVHMGQASLIMFAIIGIAWGQMPVNPSRFRGRYDDAIVAAAGPLMNVLLAALSLVAYTLWIGIAGGHWIHGTSVNDLLFHNVQTFWRAGMALNLMLFLFNLVPIPPLDGSRILSTVAPAYRRLWESPSAPLVGLVAFGLLFFVGSEYIFDLAFDAADRARLWALATFVPGAR